MQSFQEFVDSLERKIGRNKKNILFVCIGNSEILWDSIGPLVGSYLKRNIKPSMVLGDINNNICCRKDLIYNYTKLQKRFIVAIDSAISNPNLEGEIFVTKSPIIMGKGLNRNKGIIGDVSIKASISNLDKVDEKYIYNMSKIIAKGIQFSIGDGS